MTRLSVNVNKWATLRNSRGKNRPDVVETARSLLGWGAQGITVHPRPDGRHIRPIDVIALAQVVREYAQSQKRDVEFNVEGYPNTHYLTLVKEVRPHQATLVPDPPEALTSNAGWDVEANRAFLSQVVAELTNAGIRSSLFVDPAKLNEREFQALKEVGAHRIELYTEAFADQHGTARQNSVTEIYQHAAKSAHDLGLGVNAGHDLSQENLGDLVRAIPLLDEVSIGHALICEAIEDGLETTVHHYLRILGWEK